jgi:hypothetical protein
MDLFVWRLPVQWLHQPFPGSGDVDNEQERTLIFPRFYQRFVEGLKSVGIGTFLLETIVFEI